MSNEPPKLSIVTPSFNQAAFLEEALLSVRNQDYPFVEHIVVDGASTDGTVEILKKYSREYGREQLRWISESDEGQSDALNKGFKLASGSIIGWLNSDDRYRAGCFAKVAKGFASYPETEILYGDFTVIDENGRIQSVRREIEFNRFLLHHLQLLYVPTTSTFFRRKVFDDGNWIDTKFDYAMDYEFFLRLADKGYKFQHLRELLADFRIHSASKTGAHADRQRNEHNAISIYSSSVLSRVGEGLPRTLLANAFRLAARSLRCAEKLFRGYYLEQYIPSRSTAFRDEEHPRFGRT